MKILGKNLNSIEFRVLLGSFLLALLLWAAVTTDKIYSITIALPFKITRVAEGYVLSEPPPKTIKLKLKGKGRALLGLYFYKPMIKIELPMTKQTTVINLRDYQNQFNVGQELGITIVDIIEPKKLEVKVDKYVEAKRPVQIRHQIKPVAGYSLTGVIPKIDSVMVMGPEQIIQKIKSIQSQTIKIDGVRYPFTEKVTLISPYPGIVQIKPRQIMVQFKIEQIVERQLYNIPIQIINLPENLIPKAVPPVISVRIKGSEERVKAIEAEQIAAIFDYRKDYKIGRSHYVPKIELPQGVTVVQVSPRSFRLLLKKKDQNQ